MRKDKSRIRPARRYFLKSDARQAARTAHAQARQQRPKSGKSHHYDHSDYDTPQSEED